MKNKEENIPGKTAKSPKSPKQYERQYAEFTTYMIEQIAQRYKNQVLLALNKSTVNKFEDAQVGNYAVIVKTLSKRVQRKLNKQFSTNKIKKKTEHVLSRANNYNKEQTYAPIEKVTGINTTQLMAKEAMTPQINALMLETAQWVEKLREDVLEEFTANTMRAMTLGKSLDDIIAEFDGEVSKRKNHAKFVARNQVANFNAISTKLRHQKIGIKKAIWITASDERVRRCHEVRNGKEFDLSKGLYSSCDGKTLFPGVDYNCRCNFRSIIPGFEE